MFLGCLDFERHKMASSSFSRPAFLRVRSLIRVLFFFSWLGVTRHFQPDTGLCSKLWHHFLCHFVELYEDHFDEQMKTSFMLCNYRNKEIKSGAYAYIFMTC